MSHTIYDLLCSGINKKEKVRTHWLFISADFVLIAENVSLVKRLSLSRCREYVNAPISDNYPLIGTPDVQ